MHVYGKRKCIESRSERMYCMRNSVWFVETQRLYKLFAFVRKIFRALSRWSENGKFPFSAVRARVFFLKQKFSATVIHFPRAAKSKRVRKNTRVNNRANFMHQILTVHAPNQPTRKGAFCPRRKISWLPSRTGENGNFPISLHLESALSKAHWDLTKQKFIHLKGRGYVIRAVHILRA